LKRIVESITEEKIFMANNNEKLQHIRKMGKEASDKAEEILKAEVAPIYREIAGKIETNKYLPHILELLIPLKQARVVLELPDPYRKESTGRLEVSEEFAKKVGLSKKVVDKYIHELYEKGLISPTRKGPQTPRTMSQFKNTAVNNPKYEKSYGPHYLELWTAFELDEEQLANRARRMAGAGVPRMRVVPRWRAIKDIPGVLPTEDVREWMRLGAKKGPIAIYNCPCKKFSVGRTCDLHNNCCLGFEGHARYHIERGTGREVTIKEALDLFDEFDKYPVSHLNQNIHGDIEHGQLPVGILCQCHWDCCEVLHPAFGQDKYKVTQLIAKSRFEATVNPKECIGCGTCLRVCQWGGAQMKHYPEYDKERAYIDIEACMGCGSCVINCPVSARKMKLVRPPEHVPATREGQGMELGNV
jgi:NAD-dependent dihydropyrimidine dehydrogenase PreA subunit